MSRPSARGSDRPALPAKPILREMAAELTGTFILCLFGPGAVAVAVLTGEHVGLWQVASVWGFAIALAIYAVGAISGCHINPAVTVTMALFRRDSFPAWKIAPYVGAQLAGAMLAALMLLALFGPTCRVFEQEKGIVRGEPGSQVSAMWFGEYFPNPAVYGTDQAAWDQVPVATAFAAEALGTAVLLFMVMSLTDTRNTGGPRNLTPLMIGFTVACIISIIAPLTQAGLNPARDFGPRLVSYFAGWGEIAIPGPRGSEWWLYIVAPLVGAPIGAAVQEILRRGGATPAPDAADSEEDA